MIMSSPTVNFYPKHSMRFCFIWINSRDRAGGGAGGALAPPTFLAIDVRTLNVQLEIFKVLMKDGELTCFDDI